MTVDLFVPPNNKLDALSNALLRLFECFSSHFDDMAKRLTKQSLAILKEVSGARLEKDPVKRKVKEFQRLEEYHRAWFTPKKELRSRSRIKYFYHYKQRSFQYSANFESSVEREECTKLWRYFGTNQGKSIKRLGYVDCGDILEPIKGSVDLEMKIFRSKKVEYDAHQSRILDIIQADVHIIGILESKTRQFHKPKINRIKKYAQDLIRSNRTQNVHNQVHFLSMDARKKNICTPEIDAIRKLKSIDMWSSHLEEGKRRRKTHARSRELKSKRLEVFWSLNLQRIKLLEIRTSLVIEHRANGSSNEANGVEPFEVILVKC
ncbi:hypothetical protein LXL04_008265 [Taraxacum kok-saghyz]